MTKMAKMVIKVRLHVFHTFCDLDEEIEKVVIRVFVYLDHVNYGIVCKIIQHSSI